MRSYVIENMSHALNSVYSLLSVYPVNLVYSVYNVNPVLLLYPLFHRIILGFTPAQL